MLDYSPNLSEVLADMEGHCRKISKPVCSLSWYWTSKEGLCFVNLEDLAKQSGTITGLTKGKRPINVSLLKQQEAFFTYVKFRLRHIGDLYKAWHAKKAKGSRPAIHISPKQPKIARPMMHKRAGRYTGWLRNYVGCNRRSPNERSDIRHDTDRAGSSEKSHVLPNERIADVVGHWKAIALAGLFPHQIAGYMAIVGIETRIGISISVVGRRNLSTRVAMSMLSPQNRN